MLRSILISLMFFTCSYPFQTASAQDDSRDANAGHSESGGRHDSRNFTPGNFLIDPGNVNAGWIESVEGGNASSDVVSEASSETRFSGKPFQAAARDQGLGKKISQTARVSNKDVTRQPPAQSQEGSYRPSDLKKDLENH